MTTKPTVDWWKYTSSALLGLAAGLGGIFMAGASEWTKRPEVVDMIAAAEKSSQDKVTAELSFIRQTVVELREDHKEIRGNLTHQIADLQQQVARLTSQLEQRREVQ